MHPLRHDDPPSLGPYALLSRLDSESGEIPAGEQRFIGKTRDGARAVVVTAPLRDTVSPAAFLAEATHARESYNSGVPWVVSVTDMAGPAGDRPWYATHFTPRIPLPEALQAHIGALPEDTVRLCGAALAESVAGLHALGYAHAGLSPHAVLLTADGPRLTGFGLVRTAGPEGNRRTGLLELPEEFLPPEQVAGGRPRPLGDVYALGAVLVHAVTGRTGASLAATLEDTALEGVPDGLRDVLAACLAVDPAERPAASVLAGQLLEGRTSEEAVPVATVLDSGPALGTGPTDGQVQAALRAGWLPPGVITALAVQAAEVLDAEIPEALAVAPAAPVAEVPVDPDRTLPMSGGAARPSRRSLVIGLAAGTAGLAVGSTVAWTATSEDPPEPTAAQRLATKRRSRERLRGAPPNPRWHTHLDFTASRSSALLVTGRTVVVRGSAAVVGLNLATGEEIWRRDDLGPSGPMELPRRDLVLMAGESVSALDVRTGKTRWNVKAAEPRLLAADDGTVWFCDGGRHIVACDSARGRRLWSAPAPEGMSEDAGAHPLSDVLVVRSPGPSRKSIRATALSRRSGKEQWARTYGDAFLSRTQATLSRQGTLVVAAESRLKGYELKRQSGKPLWSTRTPKSQELLPDQKPQHPLFGTPVVHGNTVFVSDTVYVVRALDILSGKERWTANPRFEYGNDPATGGSPVVAVGPSGRTVLSVNSSEVAAYEAKDGTPLWRFTPVGPGERRALTHHLVAMTDTSALVLGGQDLYCLPLK